MSIAHPHTGVDYKNYAGGASTAYVIMYINMLGSQIGLALAHRPHPIENTNHVCIEIALQCASVVSIPLTKWSGFVSM